MPAPKADPAQCDLHGCGRPASNYTDGSETDSQGLDRKAIPRLNHCAPHANWPFSDDAAAFALTPKYRARKS